VMAPLVFLALELWGNSASSESYECCELLESDGDSSYNGLSTETIAVLN
jgi:hypothetical protein